MRTFEDLPRNVQALLLAKLGLELNTRQAANIHQLARMRGIDVNAMWRHICLKSEQEVCTIPVAIRAPNPVRDGGSA